MATRNILDWQGNIVGALTLPDNASESDWSRVLSSYAINPSTICPDVTPRQFRQAITIMGVSTSQIDTALASLPEPTKSFATIEWEYSTSFIRQNPLVGMVGQLLGWNSAQVDALWHLAGSL